MITFSLRRLGQAIVVVIGVTFLTFVLEKLAPGNIAREVLGVKATPISIAQFNEKYGLNRSFFSQYWLFLDHLVHGNLGFSWKQNRSVDSLVGFELPRDLVLVGTSIVLALVVAIPVGIAQAMKRNSILDYSVTGFSFFLYSMPAYVPGLLLITLLSIRYQIFPSQAPQGASAIDLLLHPSGLILPVLTLTLISYATFSRYMRSSAIDTLAQDYIRTARGKGIPRRWLIAKHLLPNSLIPVVTLIGLSLPQILTAGLIVEYLFNFQGVGLEYYYAATIGDFPVMVGITVLVGITTVIGNLVADLGYAVLDPRVRYN